MSKRIKNISGVEQSIVFNGKQLTIGKRDEMEMDDEVADTFLDRCEGFVVEAIEIGGIVEEDEESVIWVANMTGDPDARATVPQKVLVGKGSWGTQEVTNPLKEAREIRRQMQGAMVEQMGKAGLEGLNLLPITISVPPYQRRKLPTHIGKWFLQRSAMGTPGAVIKSRAKSNFEPDLKWELDDMRVYLQLVDSSVTGHDLGATFKKLKSEVSRQRKGGEEELRKKVRAAKEILMKRLHKRLADPRYRLPSKSEFDEFKAANVEAPEVAVVESQAAEPSQGVNL